jgi:hypothetical protein
MFRQTPEVLSCLQTALKEGEGNIHLALHYLVIQFGLKTDKVTRPAIDALLELNANPQHSSDKFNKLIQTEYKSRDFKGNWTAAVIACRFTPTDERCLELAAVFFAKLRELKINLPVSHMEEMFDKISKQSMREKYFQYLKEFLPEKLKTKVSKMVGRVIEIELSAIPQVLFTRKISGDPLVIKQGVQNDSAAQQTNEVAAALR